MKRLLRIAVRLYPPSWRDRYSREFDCVLDELTPSWLDLLDVLRGGVKMRLTHSKTLALVLGFALFSTALAGITSWVIRDRFRSTQLVALGGLGENPADSAARDQKLAAQSKITPATRSLRSRLKCAMGCIFINIGGPNGAIRTLMKSVVSSAKLKQLIEECDLYPQERATLPLEDVIYRMRNEIRIYSRQGASFRLSFAYTDREKAQLVSRKLVDGLIESNLREPPGSRLGLERIAAQDHTTVRISPNRVAVTGAGLAVGLAVGAAFVWFLRRRTRLALARSALSS